MNEILWIYGITKLFYFPDPLECAFGCSVYLVTKSLSLAADETQAAGKVGYCATVIPY